MVKPTFFCQFPVIKYEAIMDLVLLLGGITVMKQERETVFPKSEAHWCLNHS